MKSSRSPESIIAVGPARDLGAAHAPQEDRHQRAPTSARRQPTRGCSASITQSISASGQLAAVTLGSDDVGGRFQAWSAPSGLVAARSSGPNASGSSSDSRAGTGGGRRAAPGRRVRGAPAGSARTASATSPRASHTATARAGARHHRRSSHRPVRTRHRDLARMRHSPHCSRSRSGRRRPAQRPPPETSSRARRHASRLHCIVAQGLPINFRHQFHILPWSAYCNDSTPPPPAITVGKANLTYDFTPVRISPQISSGFAMGLESCQVGSGFTSGPVLRFSTGESGSTRPPLTLEAQHSMSSTTEAAPAPAGRTRRTLYRGDPGMWSWVLHRITGVTIFFFLFVHVLDTALVRVSPRGLQRGHRDLQDPDRRPDGDRPGRRGALPRPERLPRHPHRLLVQGPRSTSA